MDDDLLLDEKYWPIPLDTAKILADHWGDECYVVRGLLATPTRVYWIKETPLRGIQIARELGVKRTADIVGDIVSVPAPFSVAALRAAWSKWWEG